MKNQKTSRETARSRRGSRLRAAVSVVLLLSMAAVLLSGCGAVREKTFTSQGMSVTLTSEFRRSEREPYLYCYTAPGVSVTVTRELFKDYEGIVGYSLDELTGFTITVNGFDATLEHTASGIPYFDYRTTLDTGEAYAYRAYSYRSEAALWVLRFGTPEAMFGARCPQFDAWAETVKFKNGK